MSCNITPAVTHPCEVSSADPCKTGAASGQHRVVAGVICVPGPTIGDTSPTPRSWTIMTTASVRRCAFLQELRRTSLRLSARSDAISCDRHKTPSRRLMTYSDVIQSVPARRPMTALRRAARHQRRAPHHQRRGAPPPAGSVYPAEHLTASQLGRRRVQLRAIRPPRSTARGYSCLLGGISIWIGAPVALFLWATHGAPGRQAGWMGGFRGNFCPA